MTSGGNGLQAKLVAPVRADTELREKNDTNTDSEYQPSVYFSDQWLCLF